MQSFTEMRKTFKQNRKSRVVVNLISAGLWGAAAAASGGTAPFVAQAATLTGRVAANAAVGYFYSNGVQLAIDEVCVGAFARRQNGEPWWVVEKGQQIRAFGKSFKENVKRRAFGNNVVDLHIVE